MIDYITLIKNNEDWLIKRILGYAEKFEFTKYTSTLPEAWRLSIAGLSNSLINQFEYYDNSIPDFHPDDRYDSDPISEFGIIEAQKHRKRGTTLGMFLGLMKYYRLSYIDLIEQFAADSKKNKIYLKFTNYCFDRIEITYCIEWSGHGKESLIVELQDSNRRIINEKNKYLTIFESLQLPVIFMDDSLKISDLNQAAIEIFTDFKVAGSVYYNKKTSIPSFPELNEQLIRVLEINPTDSAFDSKLTTNRGELLFKVKVKRMQDVSKKFGGTVIILEDVTAYRQAEDNLLESELQYKNLANTGRALIWTAGTNKMCNFFNEIWLNFTGRSLEEELGAGWANGVHPDDLDFCLNTFATAFEKHELFEMEYRLQHASGEYKWILDIGTPNYNVHGEFIGYIGHCFDISHRKNYEKALEESEGKFRSIFEESPNAMLLYNLEKEGKLVLTGANPSSFKMLNISQQDLVGKTIEEAFPGLVNTDIPETYKKIARGELKNHAFEIDYNGECCSGVYNVNVYSISSVSVVADFIDISERKQQEQILIESEEKFRCLFEEDLTGNFITDESGTVMDCNRSFLEIFGFESRDEIVGKSILHYYEDLTEDELLKNELKKNKLIRMYETKRKRKNGETIDVVENIVADFNSNGEITEIKCHLFDITKRKLLEKSLKESEAVARTLLNTSDKVIILIDASDYRIIDINDFGAFILDRKIPDLIGKYIFNFPPYDSEGNKADKIKEVVKTGVPIDFQDEWDNRYFFNQIYPVINKDGEVGKIALFSDDITEIKKTEESLNRLNTELSESNRTKDTLFTVIAHDLRSPIASIINFSELIRENINQYDIQTLARYNNIINSTSENTLELLDNLLIWSRMQTGNFEFNPVNLELKTIIKEIFDILQPSASLKNITLLLSVTDDIIYADPNMIKTVIRNLVQNAIKFTNPGGNIRIHNNLVNHNIEVSVADNGIGIEEETLNTLFQAGKTISTKGTSNEKGTGLGLLLCKEFVEKHKGKIWVESKIGKGSEFKFTLPHSPAETSFVNN